MAIQVHTVKSGFATSLSTAAAFDAAALERMRPIFETHLKAFEAKVVPGVSSKMNDKGEITFGGTLGLTFVLNGQPNKVWIEFDLSSGTYRFEMGGGNHPGLDLSFKLPTGKEGRLSILKVPKATSAAKFVQKDTAYLDTVVANFAAQTQAHLDTLTERAAQIKTFLVAYGKALTAWHLQEGK